MPLAYPLYLLYTCVASQRSGPRPMLKHQTRPLESGDKDAFIPMQKTITKAATVAAAPAPRVTPAPRRPLSPAQMRVAPLAPIFAACKAQGLPVTPETRTARAYAVNRYFNDLPGFDWIETSFKELLGNPLAILVVADGIEGGLIQW